MSEAYQLRGFLEFVFLLTAFFACKFHPTLITQVLHFIFTTYFHAI